MNPTDSEREPVFLLFVRTFVLAHVAAMAVMILTGQWRRYWLPYTCLVLTAGVVLASVVFWMARVRMRQGRIFALAIHTASMAVVVATFAQTCAREGKFTLPLLYFAGAAALSLAVASTVHVWRRRQER